MKPTIATTLLLIGVLLPFKSVEALKCHSVRDDSTEEVTCSKGDGCLNVATQFTDPETDKQVTVFYPAGCGKCASADFDKGKCYSCNADLCNLAATNCYGTNNEVMACKDAEKQCYIYYKNKEVMSRGCGHCPPGDADGHTQCNKCYTNMCNKDNAHYENHQERVIFKNCSQGCNFEKMRYGLDCKDCWDDNACKQKGIDVLSCLKFGKPQKCASSTQMCIKRQNKGNNQMETGCGNCTAMEENCEECGYDNCNVHKGFSCFDSNNHLVQCALDTGCITKVENGVVEEKGCGSCPTPKSGTNTTANPDQSCKVCYKDGCNAGPTTTTTTTTTPTTPTTTPTTTKKKKRKIIWTPPTPKDGFTIASFLLGGR